MKKIIFIALSVVMSALSINAQDLKDGATPGDDAYKIDNSLVAGTWYKTKSDFFTLNADGTTNYPEAATYEFLPYQGVLMFYDEQGTPVTKIDVDVLAEGRMEGVPMNTGTLTVFTTTRPEQKVISIQLNYKTLSMKVGEKADLTVAVLPTDADDRTVTFTSSNPEVATVVEGARGRRSVQALSPGTVSILCRANDGGGAQAGIKVTVTE